MMNTTNTISNNDAHGAGLCRMLYVGNDEGFILQTPRCRLREITNSFEDRELLITFWNDPTVIKGIADRHIHTHEDAALVVERMREHYHKHNFGSWVVEYLPGGEDRNVVAIGVAGLLKRDCLDYPDLGWGFVEKYQRMGLGSELSAGIIKWYIEKNKELGTPLRLCGIANPTNLGSQKLLLKLGFSQGSNIILPWSGDPCCYFEKEITGDAVVD